MIHASFIELLNNAAYLLTIVLFYDSFARKVLKNISLSVMLICQLATLLMGSLLRRRVIRRKEHLALQ